MNDKLKNVLEWIYCIIIAVVIAILIKYFVGTPTIVKQSSMVPTFTQNDRLILNRLTRTMKKIPERGDIITFEAPSNNAEELTAEEAKNPIAKYENEPTNWWDSFVYHVLEIGKDSYIKRVIAIPGDHVELKDGEVYLNGEKLDEPYLSDDVITNSVGALKDFIVPENCVFAMGDNREYSKDCRAFGCIPLDKIESTVVLRFWPLNKFGTVE